MAIIHLDDHVITRGTLADLLGKDVEDTVDGQKYVATDIVPEVERLLRDEPVSAFVLDLSLDPWSHRNMRRLLVRLIKDRANLDAEDEEKFHAYRLALLAHHRGVPCTCSRIGKTSSIRRRE